jgi:hypothetical protein
MTTTMIMKGLSGMELHRVKQHARGSALCDLRLGRAERAEGWVAHLSYELGVVDAQGMIDTSGETARAFTQYYHYHYHYVYRRTLPYIGWTEAAVG